MPQNRKERLFFGILMSAMMGFVMTVYNLWWAGRLQLTILLPSYFLGVVVSFIASQLVNPLAIRWINFIGPKLPSEKHISFAMVSFRSVAMGLIMGVFGMYMSHLPFHLPIYGFRFLRNIILSLPLSYFIVNPLARRILVSVRERNS